MSVRTWFHGVMEGAKRNAPTILTVSSIGLFFTSIGLAIGATPDAMEAIEEKKQEEGHERLTAVQTIQATWKCYLASLVAALGGSACAIGALTEGNKRIAALMATADAGRNLLAEFQEYRRFVSERIGEKKEAEVYNQAAQTVVDQNPPPKAMTADRQIVDGQAPQPICCIWFDKRYVYKDYESVLAAVNKINYRIQNSLEGYASLNDLYDEMHVERSETGDRVGWSIETGLIEIPEKENLRYAGTPGGWPCWILEFINPPQYEYQFFRKH